MAYHSSRDRRTLATRVARDCDSPAAVRGYRRCQWCEPPWGGNSSQWCTHDTAVTAAHANPRFRVRDPFAVHGPAGWNGCCSDSGRTTTQPKASSARLKESDPSQTSSPPITPRSTSPFIQSTTGIPASTSRFEDTEQRFITRDTSDQRFDSVDWSIHTLPLIVCRLPPPPLEATSSLASPARKRCMAPPLQRFFFALREVTRSSVASCYREA